MAKSGLDRGIMGQNIRRMRMEKGWTQKELSMRASVSVSQLSKLEQGKCGMSTITFFKLCNGLMCRSEDILRGAE